MKKQFYDIIGDIHGCATKLEILLANLGYSEIDGIYQHPEGRKIIFLGDFIDRGDGIRRVLQIAKSMCDSGNALAVMGNHEYNAVCFATRHRSDGHYLRAHTPKKFQVETYLAFEEHPQEWEMYINWFRSLPVYLQLDGLNIIHACWDQAMIAELPSAKPFLNDNDYLEASADKSKRAYHIIETLLKGKEQKLPNTNYILDKDDNKRYEIRTKWWLNKEELKKKTNCYEVGLTIPDDSQKNVEKMPFDYKQMKDGFVGLPENGLTFVGHFWFNGQPQRINEHIACLDYSAVKGGEMTAYRWHGENIIDNNNFISSCSKTTSCSA